MLCALAKVTNIILSLSNYTKDQMLRLGAASKGYVMCSFCHQLMALMLAKLSILEHWRSAIFAMMEIEIT